MGDLFETARAFNARDSTQTPSKRARVLARVRSHLRHTAQQGHTAQGHTVLKIDIEGAEVPLLKHMLADPAGQAAPICSVDVFFVEWHARLLHDAGEKKQAMQLNKEVKGLFKDKCGKGALWRHWH